MRDVRRRHDQVRQVNARGNGLRRKNGVAIEGRVRSRRPALAANRRPEFGRLSHGCRREWQVALRLGGVERVETRYAFGLSGPQ